MSILYDDDDCSENECSSIGIITYVKPENSSIRKLPDFNISYQRAVDIYAYPMTLNERDVLSIHPILPVFMWRFGFLIKKVEKEVFRRYYSAPFKRSLWNALYGMVMLASVIFFVQGWWDRKIFGGNWECTVGYELLVAIAACCQMVLPTESRLFSRRLTYLVFFLYAFVIHTYFTSKLLSHLVVNENEDFDIEELMESDFEFLVLEEMQWIISGKVIPFNHNLGIVEPLLLEAKVVNISVGLQAVKSGNAALLTDYNNLRPVMNQIFDHDLLCKLAEVDIFSNVQKYFFTSKDFLYVEEFKIGALRAKESGLLTRFATNQNNYDCLGELSVQTKFSQIFYPFVTLICTGMFSVIIMLCEKWFYRRNKVWPYTP